MVIGGVRPTTNKSAPRGLCRSARRTAIPCAHPRPTVLVPLILLAPVCRPVRAMPARLRQQGHQTVTTTRAAFALQ
jgi:hypothetical protein